MPNKQNVESVKNLKEKISKATSIIVTDYHGLKSNQINELRAKIRENEGAVAVAKNTLIQIALKELGYKIEEISKDFQGATATIFGYKDPIAPIKTLFDFAKKLELPKIKSGFVDGIYYSKEKIESLSKIASRKQLLAQLVGSLKSPIVKFVNVAGGTNRKLVYVLAALAKQKEVQK